MKEYHRFNRYRAKVARKRIEKRLRRQFQRGIDDRLYLQVEGITDTSERLFRQLQRFLSTPMMKFNAVLDKPVYAFSMFFKFLGQLAVTTAIVMGLVFVQEGIVDGQVIRFFDAVSVVFLNRVFQLIVLVLLFINIRSVMFRLSDKEI